MSMMRLGPKPLPFQLGMASLASAGLAGGAEFDAGTLQDFFRGIQRYQAYDYKRPAQTLNIVWQGGQARLFRPDQAGTAYKIPVVFVPSMINRSDILDLLPDRSLLRWLGAHGFATYLFDWGVPTEDAGQAYFDAAVTQRLIPAIEALGSPVILVGYCMGGLFATAFSALRPELVAGQVLLATPWNFHDSAGYLKNRLSVMSPMATSYMQQYSRLPDSWMQAVFASLDPEGSIRKFAGFARMQDEGRERLFVAVEDWLNEGVDLPSGIAKECLGTWYERNAPYLGTWEVTGQAVRAGDIAIPTLILAAQKDRIVPPDSALAFAQQNAQTQTIVCDTGHVGLLAGAKAAESVWKPIADFCAAQQ